MISIEKCQGNVIAYSNLSMWSLIASVHPLHNYISIIIDKYINCRFN